MLNGERLFAIRGQLMWHIFFISNIIILTHFTADCLCRNTNFYMTGQQIRWRWHRHIKKLCISNDWWWFDVNLFTMKLPLRWPLNWYTCISRHNHENQDKCLLIMVFCSHVHIPFLKKRIFPATVVILYYQCDVIKLSAFLFFFCSKFDAMFSKRPPSVEENKGSIWNLLTTQKKLATFSCFVTHDPWKLAYILSGILVYEEDTLLSPSASGNILWPAF